MIWPQAKTNAPSYEGVAAFGKLPWAGDFLQAGHPPGRVQLTDWLEQGVAAASERGPEWKAHFDASGQKGFLLPCDKDTVVAGVLTPSQDAVGRRFPFVAYAALPTAELRASPHVAPLLLGGFLHEAGTQAMSMQSAETDIAQVLSHLQAPDLTTLMGHSEGFESWAQSESLRNAGQAVFGAGWREGLSHALYVTWESLLPFRGDDFAASPLSIRFPLGSGYAGAAVLWLLIVKLCAGWEKTIPCAVWSFEPDSSSLTVQLGPNSSQTFADIWEPTPKNENLCDLVTPVGMSPEHLVQSRPDLARLVEEGEISVQTLLQAIDVV